MVLRFMDILIFTHALSSRNPLRKKTDSIDGSQEPGGSTWRSYIISKLCTTRFWISICDTILICLDVVWRTTYYVVLPRRCWWTQFSTNSWDGGVFSKLVVVAVELNCLDVASNVRVFKCSCSNNVFGVAEQSSSWVLQSSPPRGCCTTALC